MKRGIPLSALRHANIRQNSTISGAALKENSLNAIPEINSSVKLSVVCMLHNDAESTEIIEKETEHKPVQACLDSSFTSSLSKSATSPFLDSPLNLEGLSQDLSDLLDKNVMPDVQLQNGDRTIPAHKAVLAARSKVFCAMFQHETVEKNSGIIDIKDVEPYVLEAFLKYLYSGKVPVNLSEDVVPKLYTAADKYAVSALTKVCSDFMARNLIEKNFLEYLTLADAHSDQELKDVVAGFITKHEKLLTSDIWMAFSKEHPILAIEIYQKHVEKTLSK